MVRVGWALLIIGGGALLGYALYQLFRAVYLEPGAPLVIQIATPVALVGVTILSVTVIRDRVRAHCKERFEEMDN